MTREVTVHEAKTHLSRLLHEVEAGEEIVICRGSTPVARLSAVGRSPLPARVFGGDEGKIWIADDFDDDLLPEIFAGYDSKFDMPPP